MGNPVDLMGVVVYLASDASAYTTGELSSNVYLLLFDANEYWWCMFQVPIFVSMADILLFKEPEDSYDLHLHKPTIDGKEYLNLHFVSMYVL